MSRLRALALAIGLLAAACGPGEVSSDALSDPVARVLCEDATGKITSSGSGFLVTDRVLVTNEHVIEGCAALEVVFDEDSRADARTIQADARKDLALLELGRSVRAPATLLDADHVPPSTPVVAVGFPGVNDLAAGQRLIRPSHIAGIVENDTDQPEAGRRILLISAAISPGNSGGPIFDPCGRVLGVVTFFVTDKKSGARVRAAVHVREVLTFLEANGVRVRRDVRTCTPGRSSGAGTAAGASIVLGVTALVVALRKPILRTVDERRDRRSRRGGPPNGPRHPEGGGALPGRAPRAALWGLDGAYAGQAVPIDEVVLTIGRDPAVSGLVLPAEAAGVSRRHAQVRIGRRGRVEVRDCWSSRGTLVSGHWIVPGTWVELPPGTIVELGGPGARFRVDGP